MLKEFIKTVTENNLEVYGIRVMQDGRTIANHDFGPTNRHPIYSITKSITSTAVGIALNETNLSLDDSILKHLEEDIPEDCPTEIVDNLNIITIKRLLTMSVSGYPFRPEGENWLTYSLTVPLQSAEKRVFDYSNIPAYLVGVIVEKVVKQNLIEYLRPRLFEPLGIIDPVYQLCPSGHFYGGSGMYLTVEELSKVGQLYLQQGSWNGRIIIPSEWVREATRKQIDTREGGYGYFIGRCPNNGYRMSGKAGQRCFVVPDKNLVVACLSNLQGNEETSIVDQCILETVIGRL